MIYTHAAAALISASIAATGAWQIQEWRFDAKEKAHAEQKLVEVRQSAAAAIRQLDNVLLAQNASAARAVRLRSDLDSARTELDRLRTALADSAGKDGAAPTSCPDRAATVSKLFLECSEQLTTLAGKADRHASDLRTLTDAWPK